MTSSTRSGRRRRMLHEGAANHPAGARDHAFPSGPRVRFTPPEGSASFAVAERVLPNTRPQLAVVAAGLVAASALVAWGSVPGLVALAPGAPGSVAAWWVSVLWMAVAAQCVLLMGMRRHRTDDLAGSYRGWAFTAAVAALVSLTQSTGAHEAIAERLAASTGFAPAAIWWMAPGLLVTGVAALLVGLEVRDCPIATALTVSGGVAALVSVAAGYGYLPASLGTVIPGLGPASLGTLAASLAATLVLVGLAAYARRIVRETRGEVSPPVADSASTEADRQAAALASSEGPAETDTAKSRPASGRVAPRALEIDEEEGLTEEEEMLYGKLSDRKKPKRDASRQRLAKGSEGSKWVSGGDAVEEDDFDDEAPELRKRVKADRKRQRRDGVQRRAA